MVGIRTFLRRTWGRVWIYSFFALLLMIALSFIQHVIGGINWEAFQYPQRMANPTSLWMTSITPASLLPCWLATTTFICSTEGLTL